MGKDIFFHLKSLSGRNEMPFILKINIVVILSFHDKGQDFSHTFRLMGLRICPFQRIYKRSKNKKKEI